MRIRTKLIFLLLILSVIFAAGKYLFQAFEDKRMRILFRGDNEEKNISFDKIVKLKGVSLETLAYDYTYWDEMVNFLHNNNMSWAKNNMDENVLRTYQTDAIWVYKINLSLAYYVNNEGTAGMKEFVLPREIINNIFLKERFCHFFVNTSAGLMEIRGATIHPTIDAERKTPPQGYFFTGRLWSKDYTDELGRLVGGEIKISTTKQTIPTFKILLKTNTIIFSRELADWEGKPTAYIYVSIQAKELKSYKIFSRNAAVIFISFLISILIFVIIFLTTSVSAPLNMIAQALKTEKPMDSPALEKDTSEFGDISRLISKFFKQREALVKEITERKKTEEALKENEIYLTTILSSSPVAMVLIDSETRIITEANSAAIRMIGADKNQIVGRLCHQYICPAEKGKCPISDLGQTVDNSERVLIKANGERVPVLKTVIPVTLKGRKYLLENFMDISERKKREEELKASKDTLEQQKESLENINKELDDFTYIVSHDLKEPLRSIDAYSKFIADDYQDKLGKEGKHYLERVRANTERMKKLIEDLLEISRLKKKGSTIEEVEAGELITEVKMRLEYAIKQKGVEIIIKDKLPKIFCDRVRLTEVFLNLISNAIKFNDKQKPIIEIGCNNKGDFYEFYVKDNGLGIKKEYFDKIFEIFQRLGKREDAEGTGAGLTIVKTIVQMHKGKIWLESKAGQGSTFYFTIPTDKSVILGKKLIGEILVEKKLVTAEDIKKALEEQQGIGRINKGGQNDRVA